MLSPGHSVFGSWKMGKDQQRRVKRSRERGRERERGNLGKFGVLEITRRKH